ncbi:hypothetical protein Aut01nite_21610 [Actinoplanes utahensis]|nr:hypothetical protein Aut01nite_21610 [Actinoplanes utahensis]
MLTRFSRGEALGLLLEFIAAAADAVVLPPVVLPCWGEKASALVREDQRPHLPEKL